MEKKKIVFATANKGKLREAAEILGDDFEILCSAEVGITEDIEETGETLKENSIIKAEYIYKATGLDCFADDSGLEIDGLDGEPGVHSARYAGQKDHDFEANIDAVLSKLAQRPGASRKARFRTVITLILNGEKHFFEGCFEGRITDRRAGRNGFGYDPIFVPDICPDKTVAELGEDFKNQVSHRAQALKAMAQWLNQ